MKIKIKAAVVLNGHEASVIAQILARTTGAKGEAISLSPAQREEEKRVTNEFLSKRLELESRLG